MFNKIAQFLAQLLFETTAESTRNVHKLSKKILTAINTHGPWPIVQRDRIRICNIRIYSK